MRSCSFAREIIRYYIHRYLIPCSPYMNCELRLQHRFLMIKFIVRSHHDWPLCNFFVIGVNYTHFFCFLDNTTTLITTVVVSLGVLGGLAFVACLLKNILSRRPKSSKLPPGRFWITIVCWVLHHKIRGMWSWTSTSGVGRNCFDCDYSSHLCMYQTKGIVLI